MTPAIKRLMRLLESLEQLERVHLQAIRRHELHILELTRQVEELYQTADRTLHLPAGPQTLLRRVQMLGGKQRQAETLRDQARGKCIKLRGLQKVLKRRLEALHVMAERKSVMEVVDIAVSRALP
jgi:hypothetical protein